MSFRSLKVVILVTTVLQIWGAEITCNSGCLQNGQSHNITCTSSISESCIWFQDNSKIMTCAAGGNCVKEVNGFTGTRISDTHYVLHIEAVTASTYKCEFGSENPEECPISVVTVVPVGTLGAACSSDVITCSGITEHGTPAVTLELKHGTDVLSSATTGGSVSSTQSGSDGKTYTCAVTGTGSGCLSPNSVEVTCSDIPGPGELCHIVILVVTVIFLSGSVVSLLVIYFVTKDCFQNAAFGFGGCDTVVGIICTAVYFAVCQSDTELGTSAAAFSIIVLIVGVILIVMGVLYPKCSEKPEEKPGRKPKERSNKPV